MMVANVWGQSSSGNLAQEELFSRLSVLEEEIRQLRLAVRNHDKDLAEIDALRANLELLSTEIRALKERSVDHAGSATKPKNVAPKDSQSSGRYAKGGGADEVLLYERARELINGRKYQAAIKAFNKLLSRFPQGDYAGESWYWKGELYIAQQPPDYDNAIAAFQRVVEEYPLDRKTPDAMYKMGTVYHRAGNSKLALQWLNRVAQEYQQSAQSISNLASAYIRKHDL